MPWSRISFEGGFDSPDSKWVRTIFQHLYEHATDEEFDVMALYRGKGDPASGVTLYFSPRAAARLRAAMSRFDLRDCDRPETETVDIVVGAPLAWRTEWCEMPLTDRLADAEAAYLSGLELMELFEEPDAEDAEGTEIATVQ